MSDLAYHQTEAVQLIFLEMCKSDIMHTDHNCMDNIIVSKYMSRYQIGEIWVVQGYVERQNWNIINIYFSPGIHAVGVKANYNALL